MKTLADIDRARVVHLSPGHLLMLRQGGVISTVLGSCVAVTMFHRPSSLASICHAMLAAPGPTEQLGGADERRYRFMELALPTMFDFYRRAAVPLSTLEVKVFGGANVIRGAPEVDTLGIGRANIAVARRLLAEEGIEISAENTGGRSGRKILFNASTGEVLHKFLNGAHS
jgi:chemotaxis protein CheD